MISAILALLLSQAQPAVIRSTPASNDLGMVVRQAGTVYVVILDGGSGGGGSSASWFPDGGNIGFMRMPDAGPLEVTVTNNSSTSWFPDGGNIGIVTQGPGQDGGAWNVSIAGGALAQGAVTTSAPSYTNGTTNSLSLTTTGDLRTRPVSTGTVASAVPTTAIAIGGTDGTNIRIPRIYDADTSGGYDPTLGVQIIGGQFGGGLPVGGEPGPINGTGYIGLVVNQIKKFATNPKSSSVTCGTTATAISSSPLANRSSQCLFNNGSATIYIGASSVTTSNGYPLLMNTSWCDDTGSQNYYCIVASGSENLRLLEN